MNKYSVLLRSLYKPGGLVALSPMVNGRFVSSVLCRRLKPFITIVEPVGSRKGYFDMTTVGDLVLIYFEDKPMSFARVEDILPDSKPGWFHIKLLMLQVPLQVVNWILRDVYIEGDEFTMNGNRMRMEKVVSPEELGLEEAPHPEEEGVSAAESSPAPASTTGSAKVISLTDRKRT
jgi:hypothetical protein